MPIAFSCPNCAKPFRVADELAGRPSKCPACQTRLTVPMSSAAFSPQPQMQTAPPPTMAEQPFGNFAAPSAAAPRSGGKFKLVAILSAAVLGLGVMAALGGSLVYYFVFGPSGLSSDDHRYLPNDCQVIAAFRPEQFMDSRIWKDVQKEMDDDDKKNSDPDKQLKESLGIPGSKVNQIVYGAITDTAETDPKDDSRVRVLIVHTKEAANPGDIKENKKNPLPWGMFGSSPLHMLSSPTTTFQPVGERIGVPPTSQPESSKFEEEKAGSFTMYKRKAPWGGTECFCVADSKVVVYADKPEALKKILERDKKADMSESMQAALKQADFGGTLAYAINLKGIAAEKKKAEEKRKKDNNGPPRVTMSFFPEFDADALEGVAISASVGSDVKASVTVLCRDRSAAKDVRAMADGVAVIPHFLKAPEKADKDDKSYQPNKDKYDVMQDVVSTFDAGTSGSKMTATVKIKGDWAVKYMKAEKELEKILKNSFKPVGKIEVPQMPKQ